jgi:YD repeat-containing protein
MDGSASAGGISNLSGEDKELKMCLDNDGLPIVAWVGDYTGEKQVYIKRWNGSAWVEVNPGSASGDGVSKAVNPGGANHPDIIVDSQNGILVTWVQSNDAVGPDYGKAILCCRRWNGSSWEEFGGSKIVHLEPNYSIARPSVTFNSSDNDKPVIAAPFGGFPDLYMRIFSWTGSGWSELGDFGHVIGIYYYNPSIAYNSLGELILACESGNDETSTSNLDIDVKKWNGSSWVYLGGVSNNLKRSQWPQLDFDSTGKPYVCWMDNAGGYFNIYIRHWTSSTAWEEVGTGSASGTGISGSTSYHCGMPSLSIDSSGYPVVSWIHTTGTDVYQTYVKKFNGTNWMEIGGASASGGGISLYGTTAKPWDDSLGFPSIGLYGGSAVEINDEGAIFAAWPDQYSGNWEIYLKQYGAAIPFDGKIFWYQMTPDSQWSPRSSHSSVSFNGKMWVIGGCGGPNPSDFKNDVWYSEDGITWTQATSSAAWSARRVHRSVVFDNKMWVIGGQVKIPPSSVSFDNDVWCSTDGITWTEKIQTDSWSARCGHSLVVFNGKMWLMGGNDSTGYKNDVWWSINGINWTKATAAAPWSARYVHTSVVYDGKIWVIGGRGAEAEIYRDVWYSFDGINWTQAVSSAGWDASYDHTSLIYKDRMWVIGGTNGIGGFFNDSWFSHDGINWTKAECENVWEARYEHSSVVHDDAIWVLGGHSSGKYWNDVWCGIPKESGSGEYEYIYDTLNRLTDIKSDNGVTISYEYDPAGNRLHKQVKSELMVKAGANNPGTLGVKNNASDVPIMQITLKIGDAENLVLNYLTLESSGTGDESMDVSSSILWKDVNGDGQLDGGDIQIGSSISIPSDDGALNFGGLSETLTKGSEINFLMTYSFSGSSSVGETFSLELPDRKHINASGSVSGKSIYVLGCPIQGGPLTVSSDATPPSFGGITSATAIEADILLEWGAATDPSTPITYKISQATSSGGQKFSSPDYTIQEVNNLPEVNYLVTGLSIGPTYYFVVYAEDSVGNINEHPAERWATPEDNTAPEFDGIQSAEAILDGSGAVRLGWNAAIDRSIPITYNIYCSTSSPVTDFTTPDYTATGCTVDIYGLTIGIPYYFVVRAEDRFGREEDNTFEKSAIPSNAIDTTPPVFAGLKLANALNDGSSRVYLEWDPATDPSTPIIYNIYYSLSSGGQNFDSPNDSTEGTTITLSGLTTGQQYYFVVRAEDACGNEDDNTIEKSAIPSDIEDDDDPEFDGLRYLNPGNQCADLFWNPAIDQSTPITYHIYKSQLSGVYNFNTPCMSTQSLNSHITGLTNGQFYYFIVHAEDTKGNEDHNTVEGVVVPTTEVLDWFFYN